MGKRIESVKKHLSEHKVVYIAGVGFVATAAVAYFAGSIHGTKQIVVTDVANVKLWSPTTTNVTVILEELSTPSKPVYCPELKRAFNSIHEAARETGTSVSNVSKVVAGKLAQTKGYTFEKIDPSAV